MPNIKDILYVRFRVTDLQAQKQFLEDFGFQTKLDGDLLMARGTDDTPYIYLAQEAVEPGFVCVRFAAERPPIYWIQGKRRPCLQVVLK